MDDNARLAAGHILAEMGMQNNTSAASEQEAKELANRLLENFRSRQGSEASVRTREPTPQIHQHPSRSYTMQSQVSKQVSHFSSMVSQGTPIETPVQVQPPPTSLQASHLPHSNIEKQCEATMMQEREGSPRFLSLSPLLHDAEMLQHKEVRTVTATDEVVVKELITSRNVAEHLKLKIHEQQYEIRTLRDKIALFSEATERDGQDALAIVLGQLSEAESQVATLQAKVEEKETIISGMRDSMQGMRSDSAIMQLEVALREMQHRNDVLEAENKLLREKESHSALGSVARRHCTQLKQENMKLANQNQEKHKNQKDLERILRLHLNLRTSSAEMMMLQCMSGGGITTSKLIPASERMM